MKFRILTFIFSFVFIANELFANDYKFKVLVNKGNNSFKINETDTNWEVLKIGTSLNGGETIKVNDGALLGLVHTNGKTLELKDPGDYNVQMLSEKLAGQAASITVKYADYLFDKFNSQGEAINENHRKHLNVTGAVERSLKNEIKVFIPESGNILNPDAYVLWSEFGKGNVYVVTLKNMFNEVLLTKETSDNFFKVNLDDEQLVDEKVVIFSVSVKGGLESDNYCLKRLSGDEAIRLKKELKLLTNELDANSPTINNMILASFYEKNNLQLDAILKYEDAGIEINN